MTEFFRGANAGRSVQVALTHAAVGISIGATIEGLMPAVSDEASLTDLVVETAVQVGLFAVGAAYLLPVLSANDPTYGTVFSYSLFQSQQGLGKRISLLALKVQARVEAELQQKLAPSPAE